MSKKPKISGTPSSFRLISPYKLGNSTSPPRSAQKLRKHIAANNGMPQEEKKRLMAKVELLEKRHQLSNSGDSLPPKAGKRKASWKRAVQ